jgi:glycosyltransferase involved in cell wall biosynthesis
MRRAVAQVAARQKVDLWQVEWAGYLYAVEGQRAPVVVQAPNVDSLLWRRTYEAERQPLRRAYVWGQWRKFLRFERQALRAADRVVAVSAEDAALARQLYGLEAIDVVENGVDVASYRGVRPAPESRSILFLGALDWRPNLDAARLMLDEVFPAVRAEMPEARLALVGRRPPAWLARQVARTPGARLHADVPDVRPYLAQSAVMAVPLRIGGGSRLKILEALASGLPVVSTRVGAEGLGLHAGVDYALADAPGDQAAALVEVLRRPGPALAAARQAREALAERYDWSALAERLERVWVSAARHEGRQPCTSCS